MNTVPVTKIPLLKRGSVKNLRGPLPISRGEVETIVFEFTDDFSVFDWGKMPDPIPGKGQALLGLAAHLFTELARPASWRGFFSSEAGVSFLSNAGASFQSILPKMRAELEEIGMRSTFRGLYKGANNQAEGLIVERLAILPPVLTASGYDYTTIENNRAGALIPLECVFRHSLTESSSYFERYPETSLKPGHQFAVPLVEFFTKLEPTDRFISTRDEARKIARVSEEIRLEIELRTTLLALWLRRECEIRELELVDGKFEWGLDQQGRVTLADAIGPDELRLVEKRPGFNLDPALDPSLPQKPARLSKEFLREYYRGSEWFQEIGALKKQGELASGWQTKVKASVPPLPSEALARATALYRGLERRFRPETVLLLGAGGREHAIAAKLLESPNLRKLIWAPGNDAGLANLSARLDRGDFTRGVRPELLHLNFIYSAESRETIATQAKLNGVTLVVISQDADLASGASDFFRAHGFAVFGPSKEASRIEWSKGFCKELCEAAGVPTAKAYRIEGVRSAQEMLADHWSDTKQWVVKADGLAAGKGVVVADSREEAIESLFALSAYGNSFLIEERVAGVESSWFAFADGESFSMLESAKDYKRLHDGQMGPNTGGMGAVSPAPDSSHQIRDRIRSEVFSPVFAELKKRGISYRGVLYAGIMIDGSNLNLIEFNSRFGDPETQALLPRMQSDLLEWLSAVAEGALSDYPRSVPFRKESSVFVVAAAEGYPSKAVTGIPVQVSESDLGEANVSYANLRCEKNGNWVTSGGRVLGALGLGDNTELARSRAYAKIETLIFPGAQIRKDIGR